MEVGGGKSVRKRKLPSWRRENADDCEEEEENEQIVGKRKLYSQRKNTFSRKEKGVRMLQTPVSESNRIWLSDFSSHQIFPAFHQIFGRLSPAAVNAVKIARTIKLLLNTGG